MSDDYSSAGLEGRFGSLWTRCLQKDVDMDVAPLYRELVDSYSDPCRRYHSWKHVVHCLREFDRASALMGNPDAVELAIWFHDAVYVPGAADNEQRSADLFVQWGCPSLQPNLVGKVHQLILRTTHKNPPIDEEERYLLDIDLSSFGIPWTEFYRDSQNVRAELPAVSDEDFYRGHLGFLRSLIGRRRIYHTDHFHWLYEESARQNIKRLMEKIAAGGDA